MDGMHTPFVEAARALGATPAYRRVSPHHSRPGRNPLKAETRVRIPLVHPTAPTVRHVVEREAGRPPRQPDRLPAHFQIMVKTASRPSEATGVGSAVVGPAPDEVARQHPAHRLQVAAGTRRVEGAIRASLVGIIEARMC